jgi:hypothetical protein
MANHHAPPSGRLSRQQVRAQQRTKRDAQGWITALSVSDPWMAKSIQTALGNRHITRVELEEALGISLTSMGDPPAPAASVTEPERITIQHILISFAGAGTKASRTRDEAATLAESTLQRARDGEDFDRLVASLTDDSAPGIYTLVNTGVVAQSADEYPRGGMVPAFGNVGFALAVGDIGMAAYHSALSPYGWHIIKRLR